MSAEPLVSELAVPAPAAAPRFTVRVGDILTLGKPRITLMAILTTAGGFLLARGWTHLGLLGLTLAGTALLVASANTLNMWLERDGDRLMSRTRMRPLPAGRMAPSTALTVGIAEAVVGTPLLTLFVNPWAGALGAFALLSYVLVYTPMKRRSPYALHLGAVPGAIPPLLGWTAATGHLEAAGAALFGILFFWQIPHFIAIALFRKEEYRAAGIRVLPLVKGDAAARREALVTTLALVACSTLVTVLGVAGLLYLVPALALGAVFVAWAAYGVLVPTVGLSWARSMFLVSLLYLTLLFAALVLSATVA